MQEHEKFCHSCVAVCIDFWLQYKLALILLRLTRIASIIVVLLLFLPDVFMRMKEVSGSVGGGG